MTPGAALFGISGVFILSWIVANSWVNPTVVVSPNRALIPLYAAGALAVLLLTMAKLSFPALQVRIWEERPWFGWVMVAVCSLGFAFCWWARLHLGKFWSAGVSRKEGHMVIDTGPYAMVRHPIYTGALLSVFAFTAARARPIEFLVALLFAVFFACKARLEERFLQEEFGADYAAYRQRVPMLVPFLRLP